MPIDYKRYPPNWKSEIVPAVLQRAGHRCETCGLDNGATVWSIKVWVKHNGRYKPRSFWFRSREDAEREWMSYHKPRAVTVVLTVAHLDHDEENHNVNIDRLKAMCQLCHLRYDGREKYRRAYEGVYALRKHHEPRETT